VSLLEPGRASSPRCSRVQQDSLPIGSVRLNASDPTPLQVFWRRVFRRGLITNSRAKSRPRLSWLTNPRISCCWLWTFRRSVLETVCIQKYLSHKTAWKTNLLVSKTVMPRAASARPKRGESCARTLFQLYDATSRIGVKAGGAVERARRFGAVRARGSHRKVHISRFERFE